MNRTYSMIGLASKAGKLVSGEDAVRNSIRSGKVKLTILAEDASDNTKKRFTNSAAFYNIALVTWGLKEDIGNSIGKSQRSVIGITDENFSKSIREKLEAEVIKKEIPGGDLLE
jgi:ribosomal protein L7Ae-like RNA K-turn-binding protein